LISVVPQLTSSELPSRKSALNTEYQGRRTYRASVVIVVTLYLMAVGAWLALTRRVSIRGVRKLLLVRFRKPYKAKLRNFRREIGFCWRARLPSRLISDADGLSRLTVFEDGKPLPFPHAPHEDIRKLGAGRYSHWGVHLYFSTPDNSDPLANGRRYTVEELT
jgi:hypothetical protein